LSVQKSMLSPSLLDVQYFSFVNLKLIYCKVKVKSRIINRAILTYKLRNT